MTRSADYMQSSFSATKWAAIPPCGTPGPGLCAEFWPRSRRGVLGSESQFFSSHVGHQKCQHAFFNRFSKFCSTTYRAVFGSPWGPRDPWIGLGPNTQNGFGLWQGARGPTGTHGGPTGDPWGTHGAPRGPVGRRGAPWGTVGHRGAPRDSLGSPRGPKAPQGYKKAPGRPRRPRPQGRRGGWRPALKGRYWLDGV